MAKILMIEDSKTLAGALKGALEIKGHDVIWVDDGRLGFPAVKKNMPDIILLDLMLPHVSGYEICKAVKTDNSTWRIPVIIMSTLVSPEQRERAMEAGADHFIAKPYDLKQTLAEIFRYIPKK
ncbi:MAG: response regulator [Elusimicrobiota bacterium]|jgi:DNA-binding response OmpR family regulator|nr:response regulator [Elusimicrobiota bacterium]